MHGGSSPKKAKPSELEKEQSREGVQKWNRYLTMYAPQEEKAINEAENTSVKGLVSGRSNADLYQQANDQSHEALSGGANLSQGISNLNGLARRTGQGAGTATVDAANTARDYSDSAMLGMIKTGLGQQGQNTSTLSSLASTKNSGALAKAQAENSVGDLGSMLTNTALGTAAGEGLGEYRAYKNRQEYQKLLRGGSGSGWYNSATSGRSTV